MTRPLIASPFLGLGLGLFLAVLGAFNLWQSRRLFAHSGAGGEQPPSRLVRNITLTAWGLILLTGVLIGAGELAILL